MATASCEHCKKSYDVRPYRKDATRFCSYSCMGKFRALPHGTWVCSDCKLELPKDQFRFYRRPSGRRYRKPKCIACARKHQREVTRKRPAKRLSEQRGAAKKRNLAFDVTLEKFLLIWREACHYCGQEDVMGGMDRVDNNLGYVDGNVVPCCGTCNGMKSKQTLSEFVRRCVVIAERHGAK